MARVKTRQSARGKWRGILEEFGIDPQLLTGRHGPCPVCGGNDRFRFDDRDGSGSWICSGHGDPIAAGDGFDLLMQVHGWDFERTASEVDKVSGNHEESTTNVEERDPAIRIRVVGKATVELKDCPAAVKYLKSRGLGLAKLRALRAHPGLAYYDQGEKLGEFPALVGSVRDSAGKLVSLHITYLTPDGEKASVPAPKKVLPPITPLDGSAIQLYEPGETLGVAEGIETAIACAWRFGTPTWATMNALMMQRFKWPDGVKRLIIYGDNDVNYTGHAAAYTLANRAMLQGVEAELHFPSAEGRDWADEWLDEQNA